MQEELKQYRNPDDVIFQIKNKSALKKVLKQNKKELTRKIYEFGKERDFKLAINEGKRQILQELLKKEEKLPNEEDIINAAMEIICKNNRVIQTVKPIILYLQEQGFLTENLDIAQILKESGKFQKGYFSRKWKYKKQNMAFVKIKNNITIFWNFIRGFVYKIQK
jgi:hypothetical protein